MTLLIDQILLSETTLPERPQSVKLKQVAQDVLIVDVKEFLFP